MAPSDSNKYSKTAAGEMDCDPSSAPAPALSASSLNAAANIEGASNEMATAPTAAAAATAGAARKRTFKKRKRPRGQWGYAGSAAPSTTTTTTFAAHATAAADGDAAVPEDDGDGPAAATTAAGVDTDASVLGSSFDRAADDNPEHEDGDDDEDDKDEGEDEMEQKEMEGEQREVQPADDAGTETAAADAGTDATAAIDTTAAADAGTGTGTTAATKSATGTAGTMTDEEFARRTGLALTARNSTDVADHHPVPPSPSSPASKQPPSSSSSLMGSKEKEEEEDGTAKKKARRADDADDGVGGQEEEEEEGAAGATKKPKPATTEAATAAAAHQPPPSKRRTRWYDDSSDDDWEGWGMPGRGPSKSTGGGDGNGNINSNEGNANVKGGDEEKKDEDEQDEDNNTSNGRKVAAAAASRKTTKRKRPTMRYLYDDVDIDRHIADMQDDEEFDAIAQEIKEREEAERVAKEREEREAREAKEREEREAREAKEREERERVEREERERKEREEAEKRAKKELAERLRKDREARLARLRAAQSGSAIATAATTAASAIPAATSNTTWAASSSSSVAALHAANAAYNAIPAVTKPPPPTPAPAPAPLPVAQLHRPPSPPSQHSTTRVKSESSPTTHTGRGTGRLKDDRDYEDVPIKSDPADEEDTKPRIKSDPAEGEEEDDREDAKPSADSTSSPSAARPQPVDSSSYWTAVRIKQEEHAEWRQEVEERKKSDNKKMYDTIEGKAFLFVERVLEKHKELSTGDAGVDSLISPVARDDMTFMAERMFQEQQNFWSAGKPTRVDIAYHYTRGQNMDRIRTDGLMTHAERQANSVTSNYNGSVFGDGVYTGNGPFAFRFYGDVGLIVARMKGVVDRIETGAARRDASAGIDTVIGNKRPQGGFVMPTAFSRSVRRVMENEGEISDEEDENGDRYEDEVVLQKSSQVIPLIRYSANLLDPSQMESPGNEQLHTFHTALQIAIDDFFNEGRRTWVKDYFIPRYARPVPPPPQNFAFGPGSFTGTPIVPSGSSTRRRGANPYSFTGGAAPFTGSGNRLGHYSSGSIAEIEYVAPYALDAPDCAYDEIKHEASGEESDDVCPICLDAFTEKGGIMAKMKKCGHSFCKSCIEEALARNNRCPTCRMILGHVRGQMPTGKMSVTRSSMKCKGYENCRGSLVITYDIQAAVQRIYMQNPGVKHSGKYETAYLPDNDEGRKLLERLKFAFSRGLTFVVGTSMTTGATNVVTWATIHHKTSPNNGPHGFPDPSYFANCNSELDNAGVPDFEECKKANGTKSDGEDDDSVIEIE